MTLERRWTFSGLCDNSTRAFGAISMIKRIIFYCGLVAVTLGMLTSCSTPTRATLPKSVLPNVEEIEDGSAIAFQIDTYNCTKGRFNISRELEPQKYSSPKRLHFFGSLLGNVTANSDVDSNTFQQNDPERLHVKQLTPGQYVITRLVCEESGQTIRSRNDALPLYLFFEVEAGKTNYIGQLTPSARAHELSLGRNDRSEIAKEQFDERYIGLVGDFQVRLAR